MISWEACVVKERALGARGQMGLSVQGGRRRNWSQIYQSRVLLAAVARLVNGEMRSG